MNLDTYQVDARRSHLLDLPADSSNQVYHYSPELSRFISSKQKKPTYTGLGGLSYPVVYNKSAILCHANNFTFQDITDPRICTANLSVGTIRAIRSLPFNYYPDYRFGLPFWGSWTDDINGFRSSTYSYLQGQFTPYSLTQPFLDNWSTELEELRASALLAAQITLPGEIKGLTEHLYPRANVELLYDWLGRPVSKSRSCSIVAEL